MTKRALLTDKAKWHCEPMPTPDAKANSGHHGRWLFEGRMPRVGAGASSHRGATWAIASSSTASDQPEGHWITALAPADFQRF